MEPNEIETARKLLLETLGSEDKYSVNAKRFRAQNHERIKEIDKLEQRGFIFRDNQQYAVALKTLLLLSDYDLTAKRLLERCDLIFEYLKSDYIKSYELSPNGGGSVLVGTIVRVLSIDIADYVEVFPYLKNSPVISSSHGRQDDITSSISRDDSIIKYKSFSDLIQTISHLNNGIDDDHASTMHVDKYNEYHKTPYISMARINALSSLRHSQFDCTRLLAICNEINFNYKNHNLLSVAALLRMLLDHIPPIFEQENFEQVAANFKGKSVKKIVEKLKDCKEIAHHELHRQIRAKESLPTESTLHFQNNIDVLLEEIIQRLS